jgi:hypothetical protein
MLYDLRHADTRVKLLVTCLLATFGASYLFGGWMVALYAGFTPAGVAQTYAGPGMAMAMPPDSTVVVEHPMTMEGFAQSDAHQVDLNLLVQDTHVHVPMYGVIAAVLSVVALGLVLPKGWHLGLIALLFSAPWLDFAGMWLTKLVSRDFAVVTVLGGWAMGLGYTVVAIVAIRQMWFFKRKGAVA